MFARLWRDENAVISIEYLLLGTVVSVGLVVGLSGLSTALNVEFTELSNGILALNQSYSYSGAAGCSGSHGGVTAVDTPATIHLSISNAAVDTSNVTVVISISSVP